MALELIDVLFYFWFFLGALVYVVGETYEKQLRAKLKLAGSATQANAPSRKDALQQANEVSPTWRSHRDIGHDSRRDFDEARSDAGAQTQAYLAHADQCSQVDEHMAAMLPPSPPLHSSLQSPTIPTATGFNADCVDWVNNILYLFYSQPEKYGLIVRESINRSLNEKLSNLTSSSSEFSEFMIEFSSPLGYTGAQYLPELTNMRTESESDKSVSANCKIYHKLIVFDLVIRKFRSHPQHMTVDSATEEQQYELVLENLEGKLKSIAMLADKLVVIQFIEKPDAKILLRHGRQQQQNSTLRPPINEDCLVSLILQTISNVVVDLYFGDDPDFPQFVQSSSNALKNKLSFLRGSASELKRQIKHDFLGALAHTANKERKVLVKLLDAKNINYNQTVVCLLELDAPHQLALSSTKQGSNPHWDEHFLFAANDKSDHLTLSLWDAIQRWPRREPAPGSQANVDWAKDFSLQNAKFLGQARVPIDSLRKIPVQKLSLTLEPQGPQSTYNQRAQQELSNSVGGELILELLFLEHSTASDGSSSPLSGLRKSASSNSIGAQHGDVVSVDRKLTPSGYVITTTTITKPKLRTQTAQLEQLSVGMSPSPISSLHSELEFDHGNLMVYGDSGMFGSTNPMGVNEAQQDDQNERPESGRSRSRSRSLLRAIKKRFSFSRTRSRSVSAPMDGSDVASRTQPPSQAPSRASSDLSSALGGMRARSVPPGGRGEQSNQSEVPTIVINKSRVSDATSALSFAQPKSQLVFECQETNLEGKKVTRHFAFNEPDESVDNSTSKTASSLTSKLRKRGSTTKLHLFNEHQFVATHLAGSATCHLCGRVFSRRPGKQGYRCRNCHLLSHKQCHVRVDHQCPQAKRDLQLEFIDAEPPASLMQDRRANSSSSLPRRPDSWSARSSRLANAKSVSVEVDDK